MHLPQPPPRRGGVGVCEGAVHGQVGGNRRPLKGRSSLLGHSLCDTSHFIVFIGLIAEIFPSVYLIYLLEDSSHMTWTPGGCSPAPVGPRTGLTARRVSVFIERVKK